MADKLVIGVDIGGTRTKYGLVNLAAGTVQNTMVKSTETADDAAFLDQVGSVIDHFQQQAAHSGHVVAGIGIGVPGYVNAQGVVATTYGFLRFMEDYPLQAIIENKYGLPCMLDNDARVVALGEALFGKGKDVERVLTLTLGTGLGLGFVVNGKFAEPLPLAHMGGHIKITDEGAQCYCGKTGCLEALVSSTGIVHLANKNGVFGNDISAETVFALAANGYITAQEIVEKITGYLHTGIHNYVNLFAPGMVVLGGGIAKGLLPYLQKIKGASYHAPYPGYSFQLAVSGLQELAGMLGSAALFHDTENMDA